MGKGKKKKKYMSKGPHLLCANDIKDNKQRKESSKIQKWLQKNLKAFEGLCPLPSYLRGDWDHVYGCIKAAEKDLKGFKYKGDGWYITETDTLYVQLFDTGRLGITCWNDPEARDMIDKLFRMPIITTTAQFIV